MADRNPYSWSRSGVLLLKSIGICVMAGMVGGAAGFLVIQAIDDGDWGAAIVSWPATAFFAVPIAAPFGVVCGVIATGVLEALLHSSFRGSSRMAWLALGGALGATLGVACPFFLRTLGFGIEGASEVVLWAGTGAVAGVCCGLLLGWLGWDECRHRLIPSGPALDA